MIVYTNAWLHSESPDLVNPRIVILDAGPMVKRCDLMETLTWFGSILTRKSPFNYLRIDRPRLRRQLFIS